MTAMPPEARLHRLASAYQMSCAVQAAAALGLGARLRGGPKRVADLAAEAGLDADALCRFLRFLAGLGLVEEGADGRFAATAPGEMLDALDNIVEGPEALRAWSAMAVALRGEGDAFAAGNGASFHDHAARHPEKAARWAMRNRAIAERWAPATVSALALRGDERIVELGAGGGALAAELVRRFPRMRPILMDLPHMLPHLHADLARLGIAEKVIPLGGDLRTDPLPEGDVYLLCRVLLNFDDGTVRRLFERCRERMAPSARLVIVETLMPPPDAPDRLAHCAHDLHLLLMWGGRLRSREAYARLLAAAGLALAGCEEVALAASAVPHVLTARKG